MATSDETYFRKWLDDPTTTPLFPASQKTDTVTPTSPDITYFRKYLNDHA